MSVNVRIELDQDSQRPWYTNYETVKGSVVLTLKSCAEVSSVTVRLFGLSTTSLTRIDDNGQKFTDHVQETCLLLDNEAQLFPPSEQGFNEKYSLRAGIHNWPFEFEIPSCANNGGVRASMPPSLSDMDPDVASIKYSLKAMVNHSSPFRMISAGNLHHTSFVMPIVILPSDGTTLDLLPTYGISHAQNSRVSSNSRTMSGLLSRLVNTIAHDRVPICSGVGIFTIKSELLLTPDLPFSCTIEADAPFSENLVVSRLSIGLLAKTHIRARNIEETDEKVTMLFERDGLHLGKGNLTSQLQKEKFVIPDSTPPTFSAANLKREYRLLVKLKWTHQPASALTHKTFLSKKVWVRSGIYALPNYETGEIERASRLFPQSKGYYAS